MSKIVVDTYNSRFYQAYFYYSEDECKQIGWFRTHMHLGYITGLGKFSDINEWRSALSKFK